MKYKKKLTEQDLLSIQEILKRSNVKLSDNVDKFNNVMKKLHEETSATFSQLEDLARALAVVASQAESRQLCNELGKIGNEAAKKINIGKQA
jgi:hypothetical protein